jgi:hypothetical protein
VAAANLWRDYDRREDDCPDCRDENDQAAGDQIVDG